MDLNEMLYLLIEKCADVSFAARRVIRHGWEKKEDRNGPTFGTLLQEEIEKLRVDLEMLQQTKNHTA